MCGGRPVIMVKMGGHRGQDSQAHPDRRGGPIWRPWHPDRSIPSVRDLAIPPGWDRLIPPGWDLAIPPGWDRLIPSVRDLSIPPGWDLPIR
jgi:hypothetical protein